MSKQALDGTRINAFGIDPEDLTIVGLDTDDGPEHPLYDERVRLPINENFVQLMMSQGFKSTVRVRKNGKKMEVVIGRQRVRTAREANKRLIAEGKEPLRVEVRNEQGSDSDVMGIAISENTHRQDGGPLEQADKLKRYMNTGKTESEAAIVFNCSKQHIKNLLRLLDLDESVRRAVQRGDLTASAAAPLADLERSAQKLELESLLAAGPKVTTKLSRGAAKARATAAEEVTVAPGKRLVIKVLAANKELPEKERVLSDDFVAGVLWVLGAKASSTIKGLRGLEREVSPTKAE